MKINYRPEIDGLRAFAIIAVIFYHAKITLFNYEFLRGGFIGVDIFFVISGYLISSIVIKQLNINKQFDFKIFFERRARRILPAFLIVIIFSILVGILLLQPVQLKQLSLSVLYSLGLISNYYFNTIASVYFAESSLTIPLLHYWSLSLEEQIYIVLPILIIFIYKFNLNFLKTIIILIIINLILIHFLNIFTFYPPYIESNFHINEGNFLFKFYFTQSRIWEFLSGSLIAYLHIRKEIHFLKNRLLAKIFSLVGLFLIIVPFIFYTKNLFHPSYITIIPVLGVSLILFFSNKDLFIIGILTNKIVRYIGLISYSLYLWHYPIFAYARLSDNFNYLYQKIILIIIVFFISIISYHSIENLFRSKYVPLKYFLTFISISLLLIISSSIYLISAKGNIKNYPEIISKYDYKTWNLLKLNGRICFESSVICEFNSKIENKIILIGDSVAGSLSFDLKNKLVDKDYNFTSATIGCWYLPEFNEFDIAPRYLNEINNECSANRQNYIRSKIIDNDKNIVILAGKLPESNSLHVNNEIDYILGVKNSILELTSRGHYVILIYPLPSLSFNPLKDLLSKNYKTEDIPIYSQQLQKYFNNFKKEYEILDDINHQNLIKVYPHKIFCNTYKKNECVFNDNKNLFFIDEVHPSLEGSSLINDIILEEINKIYSK